VTFNDRAGFMQLPGGSLFEDPDGTAALKSRGAAYYDLSARKWLPVRREAISSDGSQYAFVSTTGLHVVTVSSGSDRVLLTDPDWVVVGFADAVFLSKPVPVQSPFAGGFILKGLYRESTLGGTPTELVASMVGDFMIAGGYGWGLAADDAYKTETPPKQVIRIDLMTGTTVSWWYADPYGILQLAATSTGTPVASLAGAEGTRLVTIASTNSARLLYEGPDRPGPEQPYASDGHGLWMSASSAPIWFIDAMNRVHRLPSVAATVAGPCR
jgi:hypothetical protein